jgi:hypothetical protein
MKTPDSKFSKPQAASPTPIGSSDPWLEHLKQMGVSPTLANYVRTAFPDYNLETLPGELWETIPEELLDK